MKVVINKCFGGFGLSPKAILKYAELSGFKVFAYEEIRDEKKNIFDRDSIRVDNPTESKAWILYWLKNDLGEKVASKDLNKCEWFHENEIERNDENLVKTVELLKEEANGSHADLSVVKIPDGVDYEIDEYDGQESIHEKHRSWN